MTDVARPRFPGVTGPVFQRRHAALVMWSFVAAQTPSLEELRRADAATVRLEPTAFVGLPKKLQAALDERGCAIPQTFVAGKPHNAITGHFTSRSSNDWAVLCSRNGASVIVVFAGGMPDVVSELARERDRTSLQMVDPGRGGQPFLGYSRSIDTVSPAYIRQHNDRNTLPPQLNHDGIEDGTGKGSIIWYWSGRKWMPLKGED